MHRPIYLSISIRSIRGLVTMLTSCLHADLSVVVLIVSMGGLPTLARILSHHLVLGLPRPLLPSIFPCIMIFSRLLSALIMCPKQKVQKGHFGIYLIQDPVVCFSSQSTEFEEASSPPKVQNVYSSDLPSSKSSFHFHR